MSASLLKKCCLYFLLACPLLFAGKALAETAYYVLDNVTLEDGQQITGTFAWTYTPEDFEGGSGAFLELDIPHTNYSFADDNLVITIESGHIEISGNGNYHDQGLDISFFLAQPLSLLQSSPLDLGLSFFECCGNGFQDQPFSGGSISPITSPGLEVTGMATTIALCLDRTSGDREVILLQGAVSWLCGDAGLFPAMGDMVRLMTKGRASGAAPIGATLNDLTPLWARCNNLTGHTTTGTVPLQGATTIDCGAEGLAAAPGDEIMIVLEGRQ
jgi:hypothetical protein